MGTQWLDGKPIWGNDPCRCFSGEKFKKCCILLVERPKPTAGRNLGVFLTHEDLWPGLSVDRANLLQSIAQFEPGSLLFTLAKINILLHDDYGKKNSSVERGVLRALLPDVEYRKVLLWLESGKAWRVFHRMLVPTALQLVLASNVQFGKGSPIGGREQELGPILLDVNALIAHEPNFEEITSQRERDRVLAASILRLLFYSHQENMGCAIARATLLFCDGLEKTRKRYPAEHFDFGKEFESAFGFPYDQLTAFAFAIFSKYGVMNDSQPQTVLDWCVGPGYFRRYLNDSAKDAAPAVFDYLGMDFDQHAREMKRRVVPSNETAFQAFSIYNRPLFQMEPGVYIPLDLHYVSAALSQSPFWRLLQRLLDDGRKKEAHRLKSALGRSAEWYVAELLRPVASCATTHGLWLDWDGAFDDNYGAGSKPDALLLEGDVLFVVEVTTKAIPPTILASGDPDKIETELERLWFGKAGSTEVGKLTQLHRVWQAMVDGSITHEGVSKAKRIVPILITLRYEPHDPVILHWYRDLMRAKGLNEEFIRSLVMLDVPDVERLVALNLTGRSWRAVLDGHRNSPYEDQGLANYLFYSRIPTDRHPLVARMLKATMDKYIPTLFSGDYQAAQ